MTDVDDMFSRKRRPELYVPPLSEWSSFKDELIPFVKILFDELNAVEEYYATLILPALTSEVTSMIDFDRLAFPTDFHRMLFTNEAQIIYKVWYENSEWRRSFKAFRIVCCRIAYRIITYQVIMPKLMIAAGLEPVFHASQLSIFSKLKLGVKDVSVTALTGLVSTVARLYNLPLSRTLILAMLVSRAIFLPVMAIASESDTAIVTRNTAIPIKPDQPLEELFSGLTKVLEDTANQVNHFSWEDNELTPRAQPSSDNTPGGRGLKLMSLHDVKDTFHTLAPIREKLWGERLSGSVPVVFSIPYNDEKNPVLLPYNIPRNCMTDSEQTAIRARPGYVQVIDENQIRRINNIVRDTTNKSKGFVATAYGAISELFAFARSSQLRRNVSTLTSEEKDALEFYRRLARLVADNLYLPDDIKNAIRNHSTEQPLEKSNLKFVYEDALLSTANKLKFPPVSALVKLGGLLVTDSSRYIPIKNVEIRTRSQTSDLNATTSTTQTTVSSPTEMPMPQSSPVTTLLPQASPVSTPTALVAEQTTDVLPVAAPMVAQPVSSQATAMPVEDEDAFVGDADDATPLSLSASDIVEWVFGYVPSKQQMACLLSIIIACIGIANNRERISKLIQYFKRRKDEQHKEDKKASFPNWYALVPSDRLFDKWELSKMYSLFYQMPLEKFSSRFKITHKTQTLQPFELGPNTTTADLKYCVSHNDIMFNILAQNQDKVGMFETFAKTRFKTYELGLSPRFIVKFNEGLHQKPYGYKCTTNNNTIMDIPETLLGLHEHVLGWMSQTVERTHIINNVHPMPQPTQLPCKDYLERMPWHRKNDLLQIFRDPSRDAEFVRNDKRLTYAAWFLSQLDDGETKLKEVADTSAFTKLINYILGDERHIIIHKALVSMYAYMKRIEKRADTLSLTESEKQALMTNTPDEFKALEGHDNPFNVDYNFVYKVSNHSSMSFALPQTHPFTILCARYRLMQRRQVKEPKLNIVLSPYSALFIFDTQETLPNVNKVLDDPDLPDPFGVTTLFKKQANPSDEAIKTVTRKIRNWLIDKKKTPEEQVLCIQFIYILMLYTVYQILDLQDRG